VVNIWDVAIVHVWSICTSYGIVRCGVCVKALTIQKVLNS
jgi:hypothetical protein